MRVIQVVPVLHYGDAVGNDTLALDRALKNHGYNAEIYAEILDPKVPKGLAKTMDQWIEPEAEDIIIYHMAIVWANIRIVTEASCAKIGIYHNITPPHFSEEYNSFVRAACADGLRQVKELKDSFDYCLADSEFNKKDLISYGYQCPIDVLPILIPFDDYLQGTNKSSGRDLSSGKTKKKGTQVLFVGRVVPNKKHEDIITAFTLYQSYYDPAAKLTFVGSCSEEDPYYTRLREYVRQLGVKNVTFTGSIKFKEILQHYSMADLFLCMSEHEGFCVPLIEAMLFEVPIIAFDSCAVGDTLGSGGILVSEKNMPLIAGLMDRLMNDPALRADMIHNQKIRIRELQPDVVEEQFLGYLNTFIENRALAENRGEEQ